MPSIHPVGKEGILPWGYENGQTHDTEHWTGEINGSLLVVYTHSPGKRTLLATQSHRGAALGNRVNDQGPWETGFVVSRGCDVPSFLQANVMVHLNAFVVWQGTENTTQG